MLQVMTASLSSKSHLYTDKEQPGQHVVLEEGIHY